MREKFIPLSSVFPIPDAWNLIVIGSHGFDRDPREAQFGFKMVGVF